MRERNYANKSDRSPAIQITFRDGLEHQVRLGLVAGSDLTVPEHDPSLWVDVQALSAQLRQRYRDAEPGSSPALRLVRAMYHATGTDPTKRRPSSEALLRRVLRGQELYRINSLVDLCNYLSLKSLLPIGLYDLDRVAGPIELRLGREGEPYEAIGREAFHVAGRMVLADSQGPFGSPTSDSTRTMITLSTRRAMAVFFAPPEYDARDLERHLAEFSERAVRHCGATAVEAEMAPLPRHDSR